MNKPVARLHENVVWFVHGEGKSPRKLLLASAFRVTETGDAQEQRFRHVAAGAGNVFDPPIALNEMDWFADVANAAGRFRFGVQQITDRVTQRRPRIARAPSGRCRSLNVGRCVRSGALASRQCKLVRCST